MAKTAKTKPAAKGEATESKETAPEKAWNPAPQPKPVKPSFDEKMWGGRKMWECKNCNSTFFKKADTVAHYCPQIRYVSDRDREEGE